MPFIEFDRVDNIGVITLNRPERMNALGRDMLDQLRGAYRQLEEDDNLRVGVLTGAGRAFCAGRDIKEGAEGNTGLREQATTKNLDLTMTNGVAKPIVAAVNGYAGGAGFYLATRAVDYTVAAASASFQIAEIPRGIMHGWQTGFWAGLSRAAASELALGFRVNGRRAYDMGLVNAWCEDAELIETALAAARHIAAMPPQVIKANREYFQRLAPEVEPALAQEARQTYQRFLDTSGAGDQEFLASRRQAAIS